MSKLYICPTPIGHLEDITLRTLNVLKEVDVIACEDTRHSLKLLNHYGIKKPLLSYHKNNLHGQTQKILTQVQSGVQIAYISDAGMPCISDPGALLVQRGREMGLVVEVLPGASALINAFVASGFEGPFLFYGFLPAKKSLRQKEIKMLSEKPESIILYEAPHRFLETLSYLASAFPFRKATVCREMTKKHEEIFFGDWDEILRRFESGIKGEIVLVIGPKEKEILARELAERAAEISPVLEMKAQIKKGLSEKEAMKETAARCGMKKNEIYKIWLLEKQKQKEDK